MPFRVEGIDSEQPFVRIEPAEFIDRNLTEVRSQLDQDLVHLAYDKKTGVEHAASVTIATLPEGIEGTTLRVAANVDLVQVGDELQTSVFSSIDESFGLLFSPDDLAGLMDKSVAADLPPDQRSEAIRNFAAKLNKDYGFLDFRFCSDFEDSLTRSSIRNNKIGMNSLIHVCASIITEQKLEGLRHEHYRETKSGDSPQKRRQSDGARGWRVTICKHGVGWRLNYWRIPASESYRGDVIEFANVERKSNKSRILCDTN